MAHRDGAPRTRGPRTTTDAVRLPSRLVAEVSAAQRAERTRLADRIHDEPLQYALAALQELDELADDVDGAVLGQFREDLGHVVTSLRSFASSMHEQALERLDLRQAITTIAEDAARRGRLTVEVSVASEATGLHDLLIRDIVRELMANAARHGQADAVTVAVSIEAGHVVVNVADDGRGITETERAEALRRGHLGLGRLGRMVDDLGGTLSFSASEGRGTVARVRIPASVLRVQRSMEEQLGDERRWSSSLLATLQDGLLVYRDGVLVQVNDAFCRLTGYPREELIGRRDDAQPFWPAEHLEAVRRGIAQAAREPLLEHTGELERRNGSRLHVLATSAAIDDGQGGSVGRLVTVKDLTDQRRAEERAVVAAQLRTVQSTAREMTALLDAIPHGEAALLDAAGDLICRRLGWREGVIRQRADDGTWSVTWTSSAAPREGLSGRGFSDEQVAAYMQPRYARLGAVWCPAGEHPPGGMPFFVFDDAPASTVPGAWQPADLLLVPMCADDRTLLGLVGVDKPVDGRRPDDEDVELLVSVCAAAGRALSLARDPRRTARRDDAGEWGSAP